MTYEVAIPSYDRAETLVTKTLRLLIKRNIDPKKITIFVANKEQEIQYRSLVPSNISIVVGEPGMKNIRNFMVKYYKEGTQVVFIDDDIEDIFWVLKDKLVPYDDLDVFFKDAFFHTRKENGQLWGIYPVANAYFMKVRVTYDLRYIIGALYGQIIDHELLVTMDNKEDYERTIKSYLKYGKVLRFEFMTMKTAYYTEPGGMQSQFSEGRLEDANENAKLLVETYPDLCKLKKNKSRPYLELRLKDRR